MAAPLPALLRISPRLLAGGLLVVALSVIGALLIASRSGTPGDESVEAGFARDMATHHAQAVEMSFVIRDMSRDEELRTLAYDIIVTQSTQRGVFMGWLQTWGLPQSSTRPRMAWMPGHAHTAAVSSPNVALMHGMASDDALRQLREAQGADAEILFLQLMIRHHEGGVLMARALGGLTRRAELLHLAKGIEDGQRAEIAEMTEMLAKRSARPYESLLE